MLPLYRSNLNRRWLKAGFGESFLYRRDGDAVELSPSALHLVQECGEGSTIDELVDGVTSQFPGCDAQEVRSDVVHGLSGLIDAGLVVEQVPAQPKLHAPLLITGSARSGSTALARHLSTHHRFCIFNEYNLFNCCNETALVWRRIQGMRCNQPPRNVAESIDALKKRLFEALPIPASDEATRNWLFGATAQPSVAYGDKMPSSYLLWMTRIRERFPGARFLVTLRDGRAVVASQIRAYRKVQRSGGKPPPWAQASVEKAQELWLKTAAVWADIRHDPPAPCLEVRYEEAARSPERLAKRICDFTDVPFQAQDFEEFFRAYRPVHLDAWKEEIPDIESRLSPEFQKTLRRLGYEC